MGQSSNDVIPSAIHVSAAELIKEKLIPALKKLEQALDAKAKEFWDVIKIGRTHLMDATPVRLGQEFGGYAQQVRYGAEPRAEKALEVLKELALGGTAVGTGLNRHPDFPGKVLRHLEHRTGIAFHRGAQSFRSARREGRRGRSQRPAQDHRRPACSRSPTISAGWAAGRAAASARFSSRRRSPAARSCPAR